MVDICTLPSRALLRLTGADATEWLQGLITNDVERLDTDGALYAALLSPQGKILFDFLIYRAADSLLIDCEASARDALMKRLSMYKMRSDVTLTPEPDLGVLSSCTPLDASLAHVEIAVRDPRLEELGFRMVGDLARMASDYEEQDHSVDGEDVYRDYLLKLGVPNGEADFAPGKAYPLESNFDELNGISFTKGCFIGQEVAARMKHKTDLKKRILPVVSDGAMPEPGTQIRAGDAKAGDILSGSGSSGLALMRLAEWRAAMAQDIPLETNGVRVRVNTPEWLNLKEDA